MSLGTDTNPQSVIEAMRWAAVVSKMMERNTEATGRHHESHPPPSHPPVPMNSADMISAHTP